MELKGAAKAILEKLEYRKAEENALCPRVSLS